MYYVVFSSTLVLLRLPTLISLVLSPGFGPFTMTGYLPLVYKVGPGLKPDSA